MNDVFQKPLPEPSIDSAPYWSGLKEGRVLLQRCCGCGTVRHYPRPVCGECYSMEVEWIEASGKGTVYSWFVAHHPFHVGFKAELPYTVVTVDLAEGVRMEGQLLDADQVELQVGMPVDVVLRPGQEDWVLPYFKASAG